VATPTNLTRVIRAAAAVAVGMAVAAPAAAAATWPDRLPGPVVGAGSAGSSTAIVTRADRGLVAITLERRGRSRRARLPLGPGTTLGGDADATVTRHGEVVAALVSRVPGTPAGGDRTVSCCDRVLLHRWRPGRRPRGPQPISPDGADAADTHGVELRVVPLGAAGALVAYTVSRPQDGAPPANEVQLTLVTRRGTRTIAGGALQGATLADAGELPGGRAAVTIVRLTGQHRLAIEQIVVEADGVLGPPQRVHEAAADHIGAFRVATGAGDRRFIAGTKLLEAGRVGAPLGPSGDPGFVFHDFIDNATMAMSGRGTGVFTVLRSYDRSGAAYFAARDAGVLAHEAPPFDRAVATPVVVLGARRGAYAVTTGPSPRQSPAAIEFGLIAADGAPGPPRTLRSAAFAGRPCWATALVAAYGGDLLAATVCTKSDAASGPPRFPLVRVPL
jgi:hypothetical protein